MFMNRAEEDKAMGCHMVHWHWVLICSMISSASTVIVFSCIYLLPCTLSSLPGLEVESSMESPVYIFREEPGPTCSPGPCPFPSSSWLVDWAEYGNNSGGLYDDLQQNHTNISPAIPIIITAVYSMVFVVGLVGNSLVMFVIISSFGPVIATIKLFFCGGDDNQINVLDTKWALCNNKAKHGIGTWILEVINTSLRDGWVPAPLKEVVIRPVLKKASLNPEMATNYRPVANIPFLGKVLEWVVAGQLQALLDETDYLDPFQSGFRPGYGTESALVTLYDDLCRERDRESASLLVLLDLSVAFDTIEHGILLDRLAGLGVGGTALQCFCSYLNG
ncbi:Kappa-type opioid receptor [Varanus komodoensis]|nr:Kappa-type opioid receptor [Varanus komodoensis]